MTMPAVSLVLAERYAVPRQVSIGYGHMTREGGERLRALLETAMGGKHGWVTALAAAAHVRRATVYSWFTGASEPSGDTLRDLARATGLHRWELIAAIDGEHAVEVDSPDELDRIRAIVRQEIARQGSGG